MSSVVISSHHAWRSPIHISAHHIAEQFHNQGWQVLFLSDPVSPLHALRLYNHTAIRQKFHDWLNSSRVGKDGYSGKNCIASFTPFTCLPYSRFWPLNNSFTLSNWRRFCVPRLSATLANTPFIEPDLMIVDCIIQECLIDCFKPKKLIYRVTDAYNHFFFANKELRQAERKLAQRADIVIYTAKALNQYVSELQPKRSAFVSHGIDLKHFSSPIPPRPREYEELTGDIALFIGSLEDWVDMELIELAAQQLPDINFVLIGPHGAALKDFKSRHNLIWLGCRSYADIPAYLHHANIGLIPFNVRARPELVRCINPIKAYEYLACKLPVVASRTEETEAFRSVVYLYSNLEEFIHAIRMAQVTKPNMRGYEYVQTHDWSTAYQKITDLIQ